MTGADDGTVEGENTLTDEEVVEGESGFVGEEGAMGSAARGVGAGEDGEGGHRAFRGWHAC